MLVLGGGAVSYERGTPAQQEAFGVWSSGCTWASWKVTKMEEMSREAWLLAHQWGQSAEEETQEWECLHLGTPRGGIFLGNLRTNHIIVREGHLGVLEGDEDGGEVSGGVVAG